MTEDPVLSLERVMLLVGDCMEVGRLGQDPRQAAREIVARIRPSLREVAAARRENQDLHGGGTPEPLRQFVAASPIPEDIARLRRVIDDVLAEIHRVVAAGTGTDDQRASS